MKTKAKRRRPWRSMHVGETIHPGDEYQDAGSWHPYVRMIGMKLTISAAAGLSRTRRPLPKAFR